jgi:hypothetical protein
MLGAGKTLEIGQSLCPIKTRVLPSRLTKELGVRSLLGSCVPSKKGGEDDESDDARSFL